MGGGNRFPLFPTSEKVRGGHILNIVIVVGLEIKNLEESDSLTFYQLKLWISLTFYQSGIQKVWLFSSQECEKYDI